ncbi:MAG: long-chain fatty acid--CoA ligase [Proteobacteria bacterium]|nr:long-chain fatty acid--CoA ligase [Pseudomonadota bacterium]MBI3495898.1 long-chain fatty acid--CoA ligase [Pseudomonadota bacterium]
MAPHPWEASYPPGRDWHAEIAAFWIDEVIDRSAARWPERTLIDFYDRRFSHRDMLDLSGRAARGLQELGVTSGTHVGLHLANVPHYVALFFGVLKAGGRVVNYSPLYAEREILRQIEDSETDILITLDWQSLYPKVAALAGMSRLKAIVVCSLSDFLAEDAASGFKIPQAEIGASGAGSVQLIRFRDLIANDGAYRRMPRGAPGEEVAVLQYTGGTTGVPKGAMLTHANLSAAIDQSRIWVADVIQPGAERALAVLPFFHVYGLAIIMLRGVWLGFELVLHLRFDVEKVLADIAGKRISLFSGVPTMYTAMVQHPGFRSFDLSSLKLCSSGGAPMPVEILGRFEAATGCILSEGYGLTETAPTGSSTPPTRAKRAGTVGVPMPGTVIEIRDLETGTTALPPDSLGEVSIKGPQVMKGYWKRPEETASVLKDGWFMTGDIGRMSADGTLTLIERKKDMIISGGFNVYPRMIEEAIYEHESVAEVIVIGIPDDYRGQSAKAFVRLKSGTSLGLDELNLFLADKLGRHELPSALEIRQSLPRTAVGKLSRKELVAEESAKRQAMKPVVSS